MAMVDRYKKSGGFVQLLQVIETCGPKKREQFMGIIAEETPAWAQAISEKMLTFEKILSWKPEAILEITANVNPLAFATAVKGLAEPEFKAFCDKLSPQEKRKIEQQCKEITPSPNEIASCVMKVITETRNLFTTGGLKFDKIAPELSLPDEIESKLDSGSMAAASSAGSTNSSPDYSAGMNSTAVPSGDADALRRKVVELNHQINNLRKENLVMKDKLDKIKRIA